MRMIYWGFIFVSICHLWLSHRSSSRPIFQWFRAQDIKNGFQLRKVKCEFNWMLNFLTSKSSFKTWNRFLWRMVGFPSMDVVKQRLDTHLSGMIYFRFLHWAGKWTWWPQFSFTTPWFHDFIKNAANCYMIYGLDTAKHCRSCWWACLYHQ